MRGRFDELKKRQVSIKEKVTETKGQTGIINARLKVIETLAQKIPN